MKLMLVAIVGSREGFDPFWVYEPFIFNEKEI